MKKFLIAGSSLATVAAAGSAGAVDITLGGSIDMGVEFGVGKDKGSMSIGEIVILPETFSSPQIARETPVTMSSLPSVAQPPMSAIVQPHRDAVSCRVKNAL